MSVDDDDESSVSLTGEYTDDSEQSDHVVYNREDFEVLTVELLKRKYWDPIKKRGKKIECFGGTGFSGPIGRCLNFTPNGNIEVDTRPRGKGTIIELEGPYEIVTYWLGDQKLYKDWLSGPAVGPYPETARRCKEYATFFSLCGTVDFLYGDGEDEEGGLQISSWPVNGVCNNAMNGPVLVRRDD